MCYDLDRLLTSMNKTNFIFVHNIFILYVRFLTLINGLFMFSVNLPLEVLSVSVSFGNDFVEFLDLCVVLRFLSWGVCDYYFSTVLTPHTKVSSSYSIICL